LARRNRTPIGFSITHYEFRIPNCLLHCFQDRFVDPALFFLGLCQFPAFMEVGYTALETPGGFCQDRQTANVFRDCLPTFAPGLEFVFSDVDVLEGGVVSAFQGRLAARLAVEARNERRVVVRRFLARDEVLPELSSLSPSRPTPPRASPKR
jgi:hypothetical protein